MNIPEKYINEIMKKYRDKPLTREMIIKDLALSYILQEMANHKKENNSSPFNKIIFKGGTLLAKSHLNYHRISEDLDFTYKENFRFNLLSKNKKVNEIKIFIKTSFLPVLSQICKKYNFDFDSKEINETGKKYCPTKSSLHLMTFNVYINKKEINPIKIDLNFCDEPFYSLINSKIIHLNSNSEFLIFPLNEIEIESYDPKEIIIEKIRAILTRDIIHERDIYDLYLLFKSGHKIFDVDEKAIFKKIKQGIGYNDNKKKEIDKINNFEKRLKILENNFEGEIKDMNLTDYNQEEYLRFFNNLKEFIASLDFKNLN